MRTEDIKKMAEAYLEVVSEKKKLDPVDDKENDKKFKNRKDKDIDNDGDVDSSDEYLHKKRAATDDAIDAKKSDDKDQEGGETDLSKDKKKKKPVAGNTDGKTAEISKIGEKVTTKEDLDQLVDALGEAAKAKPEEGEKIDDKESPKSKEFIAKHKKSDPEHEKHQEKAVDATTKAGNSGKEAPKRPGDNKAGDKNVVNPVKEDTRTAREKIMDVLSGKTWGEIAQEVADQKVED
jgi:hypothetical protein